MGGGQCANFYIWPHSLLLFLSSFFLVFLDPGHVLAKGRILGCPTEALPRRARVVDFAHRAARALEDGTVRVGVDRRCAARAAYVGARDGLVVARQVHALVGAAG